MDPRDLTVALKRAATDAGFDLAGACPAVAPTGISRLRDWLAEGCAGEMGYIESRIEAYADPNRVLDGARSVLMLAANYRTVEPTIDSGGTGRVSRYAWGADYHDVLRGRLDLVIRELNRLAPGARARGVVDTAPFLEREFAQLAGLGWIGKNTMLIDRRLGSWFFLAAVLTDTELAYDDPHATDHCGTCRACLDACPTHAFVAPHVLDSRRCISYLTIELKGPVPRDQREGIGDWVFGCDICQEVCPWNGRAPGSDEPAFAPRTGMNPTELRDLLALDDRAFRDQFRDTPLWRPRRRGLLRNAAIVLGNQRDPASVPALSRGINDGEPLIRGACAWALGQIGGSEAEHRLVARHAVESDAVVRDEIELARSTGC